MSAWIEKLKDGDERAADVIWSDCFERLVSYARGKMEHLPRRAVDEEDVALSALHSFVRRARGDEFQQLLNRNDLWRLLFTITARKVTAAQRKHYAEKRGGGQVRGESVFQHAGDDGHAGLENVFADQPSAAFATSMGDMLDALIGQLDDQKSQQILLMKLEGHTTQEIAEACATTTRTVERRFAIICEIGRQLEETH
ncbi:ECF-type sigma factor [Neorhodopirellula lusitana]|uniref:ECF-type sigma factor n=1 Tax=Neorhodopirellula lusitana TaxID=445327 RepID=UPI003851800D